MQIVIVVLLEVIVQTLSLWGAAKILEVEVSTVKLAAIAAASSIFAFLPSLGWLLGILAMIFLLRAWSNAKLWPDVVVMIVAAGVGRMLFALLLAEMYAQGG